MNIKKMALAVTSSGLSLAMYSPNAMAYAQHEHPFAKVPNLSRISQQDGDTSCRKLFSKMTNESRQKRLVKDAYGHRAYSIGEIPSLKVCPPYLSSANVKHVWAHRNNGECIANVS